MTQTGNTRVSLWRARVIAFARIAFGLVWVVAAWLKWQPKFLNSFSDTVTGAKDGQSAPIQAWISFWGNVVGTNPHLFAIFAASVETALAVFLIFGILTNLACVVGFLYSIGVWSVAEGFGGPYKPGQSTDVGTALPYAIIFLVLLGIAAGRYYSVDQWLTPRLGRFNILAAGPTWKRYRKESLR